jgi:putative FmdB family regulatory protein
MPTYQYKCENQPDDAEHRHNEVRSMSDPEPENSICKVEGCGGKLIRIFNAPPIQFKGMGFSTNKSWR